MAGPGAGEWSSSSALAAMNLAALGVVTYEIVRGGHLGREGRHLAALLLLVAAAGSWLGWVVVRKVPQWRVASLPALTVMALAGGALTAFTSIALVFPVVAALGAGLLAPVGLAAAIGGGGWVAMFATLAALDRPLTTALSGLAAISGGLAVGVSRRQAVERAQQATRLELETARAEVERGRAELLAERNRLARELHDVLAHTLSALSLQLEAFGTVVDANPDMSAVREQLARTQRLVREGLDEARGAVQALRDDAAPLPLQLQELCALQQAGFTLSGPMRTLSAPVALCLYRVTQEALTNVRKHAAGAAASVCLSFEPERVTLCVDNSASANGAATTALGGSGAGYGLRGIGERVELLGGRVQAGPTSGGWRVMAEIPTAP